MNGLWQEKKSFTAYQLMGHTWDLEERVDIMSWTDKVPLWDHHCHVLVQPKHAADLERLGRALTEARGDYPISDIRQTVTYQEAISVAASHLGTECDESSVQLALGSVDYEAYCRGLFLAAGYEKLLIDTGYQPPDAWEIGDLKSAMGLDMLPILRLETMAEQLIARFDHVEDWIMAVKNTVQTARTEGYVGVKSIIAYRSGLFVHPVEKETAQAAYRAMKAGGITRLTDADLLNYLLWSLTPTLITEGLTVQFHTGYGDPDTDLAKGNPLLLREYLERYLSEGLHVVLLHTYPFHREAGYLASVYPGVYFDVSLAVPLAASGASRVISEALELAPTTRFLFASDAHSRPESFFMGAQLWRRGIDQFLDKAVKEHHVSPSTAYKWASMICWSNCKALYSL
ncbi:MAG: hydrolase [Sulfobacillus benefaciens]|uniref:Hydrolase n=1 Tax=Sulfobacillus benefaciens TaxID=453960 RepID=A0A2T2XIU7_9FIRM|nr:MAG: hydrolase [Sulfobacillus benefaciens]